MNTNTTPSEIYQLAIVSPQYAGKRLDQIAVDLFPQFSRSRLQAWIKSGELLVDGKLLKQTARLSGGEEVAIRSVLESESEWLPESMDLRVVYEDDSLLVIDKPPGLVVHPAAGNWTGTLLNGLLAYAECFHTLPRAGIVHRLDKDTSGLMVVAKTLEAQTSLVKQMQARSVKRQYRALSMGGPDSPGSVDAAVGRHPNVRTKMAVVKTGGKEALTHYKVRRKHGYFRDVELELATGRTHQIRVHMNWLGFPLVGDQLYGKKLPAKLAISEELRREIETFPRQALHAQALSLQHPTSETPMSWHSALPDDFANLLGKLVEEA